MSTLSIKHIVISGGTDTSRHNIAFSMKRYQKIKYTIQVVLPRKNFPLLEDLNYMLLTPSLDLIPQDIKKISVLLRDV
jgi:hypothetical protein